jgi:ketosteroid isomerase-like protein
MSFCYHTQMRRKSYHPVAVVLGVAMCFCCAGMAQAQNPLGVPGTLPGTVTTPATGTGGYKLISPAVSPTWSPGVVKLMELEGRFAEDVATNGGKAFANWFADDAVSLSDGKPAVRGRGAIAASANWDPKAYSLTWTPQGAEMSPSNEMGYTWGHYIGKSMGPDGKQVATSGRYITIWKKLPDGSWKVALDAGATDAPEPAPCCAVPRP